MSSLTIQNSIPNVTPYDQAIPKPAWPMRKPLLRVRIALALLRCYGVAGVHSAYR